MQVAGVQVCLLRSNSRLHRKKQYAYFLVALLWGIREGIHFDTDLSHKMWNQFSWGISSCIFK